MSTSTTLQRRTRRLLVRLAATFWLRPALAIVAGVALVGVTVLILHLTGAFGILPAASSEAISGIVSPLASSALTITTVTFSVLIVLFQLAGGSASPRSLPQLMADPALQNALATFLGVFAYAVTASFVLSLGSIDASARSVLAAMAVIAAVGLVGSFVRFVDHICDFMKLGRIIERTHDAAARPIADLLSGEDDEEGATPPDLGPWPEAGEIVHPSKIGYIADIDLERLADITGEHEVKITVSTRLGDFVSAVHPLVVVHGMPEGEMRDTIIDQIESAFEIARDRIAGREPRLGLQILGEIGCRALSPGINDPMTAVVCIDHLADLLARPAQAPASAWCKPWAAGGAVRLTPIGFSDLLGAGLPLIVRSGGLFFVVIERLLDALAHLEQIADPANRPAIRALADEVTEHAEQELATESERLALAGLRRKLTTRAEPVPARVA